MCVFSPERVNFKYTPVEEEESEENNNEIGRKRVVLGSLVTITAIFGELLAHNALSILIGSENFTGEKSFKP